MSLQPSADPIQSRILHAYTALHQLRPDWGGALILSLGLDAHGAALAMAAHIAGAVSLSIDNDPAHIREVVRTGAADFVVTTLDEAIRTMKNEVRRHAPLSVALNSAPLPALEEITERGLAPQLFTSFLLSDPRISEVALRLQSHGATLIHFGEEEDSADQPQESFRSSRSLLAPLLEQQSWQLHTFTFDTPVALRHFDAQALVSLPAEETLRRRWLESAPRLFLRQRPPQRTLWLTKEEIQALQ